MALVLYELLGADDRRFSPHVWRSLMALHHKGLTAERRPLNFVRLDQVAFSGHKRVPVLTDGERTVSDSWDIACYLEDAYPDAPSLFGGSLGRAQSHFINNWANTQQQPGLMRLIVHDIHDHLVAEDKAYFRTSREARLGAALEDYQAEGRANFLEPFRRSLEPLRATLLAQPFLCGDAPAYADYIVFGGFQWARCVSTFPVVEEDDPICSWCRRMLGLYDGLAADAVGYPIGGEPVSASPAPRSETQARPDAGRRPANSR